MDQFVYKHNPEHRYYMVQQVWECLRDLSIYSQLSQWEHEQIAHLVPSSPKVVMDLGCGIGRAGIYLDQAVYKDDTIHYILADRHGDTPTNTGAWGANEYYNDLNLTSSFALLNGMDNFETFDTESDWTVLPNLDFVTSRYSFGVHVRIEPYIEKLVDICNKDVVLLFGVRDNHYQDGLPFSRYFSEVRVMPGQQKNPFPYQGWLYARGLK